jgi:hypothetical protein
MSGAKRQNGRAPARDRQWFTRRRLPGKTIDGIGYLGENGMILALEVDPPQSN